MSYAIDKALEDIRQECERMKAAIARQNKEIEELTFQATLPLTSKARAERARPAFRVKVYYADGEGREVCETYGCPTKMRFTFDQDSLPSLDTLCGSLQKAAEWLREDPSEKCSVIWDVVDIEEGIV